MTKIGLEINDETIHKKKGGGKNPFKIEMDFGGQWGWRSFGRYKTKEQANQSLENLKAKFKFPIRIKECRI